MTERLNRFKLITYQNIDIDERNVVTLLYQPLIGCKTFSLYLTLWSLIDRSRLRSPEYMCSKLYDILGVTPKIFIKLRRTLEAIGLLVVYQNDDLFLFELRAPLSAEEFIKDGSLGAYLLDQVGESNFNELVDLFRIGRYEKDGFKNITTNFDDVFKSVAKPVQVDAKLLSRNKSKLTIEGDFNFDLFFDGLSKNFVDHRKITKRVKEKIRTLAYVYNLDEFTMQKVFMDSVEKDKSVDVNKLSKRARYWFQFEKKSNGVKLDNGEVKDTSNYKPNELVEICKNENPLSLVDIIFGEKPTATELKTVEYLIEQMNLSQELINFLIVYVLGNTNGSFPPFSYFEKVAREWQRNGLTTVEEAILYVKKRNGNGNTNQKYTKAKNELPQDIENDWIEDYFKNL